MATPQGELRLCAAGFRPEAPSHYIVWRLREVKELDAEAFKKETPNLHARIVGAKSVGILEDWLLDQRQAMRIIEEDDAEDAKKKE